MYLFFKITSASLFFVEFIYYVQCLQVIPEIGNFTYINKKYLTHASLSVTRYGRKSGYYINIEGNKLHCWSNNITAHLVFYEYLHNEYRRSFIEMHYKLCDLINKEPYVGGSLRRSGLTCPIPKGYTRIPNITVATENFPNVFPFEKGLVEILATTEGTGDVVMKGSVRAIFKRDIKKKIIKN